MMTNYEPYDPLIESIHEQCNSYGIKIYKINKDLSIDVTGDVNLSHSNLYYLPLRFNKVKGDFFCHRNKLTTLSGCPKIISGNFACSSNQLTSLEHGPVKVGRHYNCNNNLLISLEYCPDIINGFLDCDDNKLTNLDFKPKGITNISFSGNPFMTHSFCHYFNALESQNDDRVLSQKEIFLKYMDYYEIWIGGVFQQENLEALYNDVIDGLE